MNKVVGGSC